MATIQRIGQIQAQRVTEQREVEQLQRRLNLFTSSTFERARSLAFNDGTRVDVPSMSEEDRNTAGRIFASIPTEKQAAVQAAFDALANAIYDESKKNPQGIQVGSFSSGLTNQLNQSTEVFVVTTGKAQADQAVQGVMFGAMIGIEQDLGNFAQNVQDRLNLAGTVRTDVTELRNELSDWDDPNEKRHFEWTEVTFDEAGNMHVEKKEGDLDKKEAEELLEKLEMQMETLSDMNEMMKFDLQQKTHDYQQALGTLSGLLKASHESLMAIIRNVKAS
jgi:hypothetical protein